MLNHTASKTFLRVSFNSLIFQLIFYCYFGEGNLSIGENGILKSPTITVTNSTCLEIECTCVWGITVENCNVLWKGCALKWVWNAYLYPISQAVV